MLITVRELVIPKMSMHPGATECVLYRRQSLPMCHSVDVVMSLLICGIIICNRPGWWGGGESFNHFSGNGFLAL